MSIPNRGTAGAVLDATNSGLTRVEGGAVWFPTIIDNYISNASVPPPPTGPATIVMEARLRSVTSDLGTYAAVCGLDSGGPSRTFFMQLSENGAGLNKPSGFYPTAGPGVQSYRSSVPDPYLEVDHYIRHTITAVGSDGRVVIESSLDGSTWVPVADMVQSGKPPNNQTTGSQLWQLGSRTEASRSNTVLHWCRITWNGSTFLEFDASTDISDPAAASFVCSTGQTVTVNRATSGPVTTLVPAGTVVYINPDAGAATRLQTAGANQTFDVASGEDLIVAWCGQPGPQPPGLFGVPFRSSASGDRVDLQRRDTGQAPGQGAKSVVVVGNVSLDGGPANLPAWPFPTVVHFLVLNKATGLAQQYVFDEAGIVSKPAATSIANMGAMVAVAAMQMMQHLTGTFSSALWKVGVGIAPSDTELASIAAALLANANRPPVSTTGTLPPAGHKVRGDRYRASNGHIAMFDGAKWVAQSPATGNIAALLGNNQLLLGAS